MPRNEQPERKNEALLKLPEAASQLGISFPTIKQ